MVPGVADLAAGQQLPDEVHSLVQHRQPLVRRRPRLASDVLVQSFARTHAQSEAALREQGRGSGCLRHNGRMRPAQRAGHCGGDRQRASLRDRADHRPDEPAVALRV